MTKATGGDLDRPQVVSLLIAINAGIEQCDTDRAVIESATTLGELRPVLAHLNDKQEKILKALKFIGRKSIEGG